MARTPERLQDRVVLHRAVEISVRLGLVALLGFWCFQIARPFLQPILWSVIIAVAAHPLHERLRLALGGRARLAAALVVAAGLLLLIVPTVVFTANLVETATHLSDWLRDQGFAVPPPPASVAGWPLIGEPLHGFWTAASQNLDSVLRRFAPQLLTAGQWLLETGATTGIGIAKFAISIVIAGALLANAPRAAAAAQALATRVAGERGAELTELSRATVQSVTRGILGVAVFQSLMAGVGMLAAGVPATGLWTLLVLLLAVVQLPTLLVLVPVVVYVFWSASTTVAVAFAIWSVLVGSSDNVLKPLLMGRGVDAPMLVIFMGAIGGFMLNGIIGLFVGAVVLALGYALLTAWLEDTGASA